MNYWTILFSYCRSSNEET